MSSDGDFEDYAESYDDGSDVDCDVSSSRSNGSRCFLA